MFEVEFLSQRICILYILTYIVKLYIEKLYKYNPINSYLEIPVFLCSCQSHPLVDGTQWMPSSNRSGEDPGRGWGIPSSPEPREKREPPTKVPCVQ